MVIMDARGTQNNLHNLLKLVDLPPQRLVDLLRGSFVRGLRENMFFNYQVISWEIPGRPSL